jgi:hypothetical protein
VFHFHLFTNQTPTTGVTAAAGPLGGLLITLITQLVAQIGPAVIPFLERLINELLGGGEKPTS